MLSQFCEPVFSNWKSETDINKEKENTPYTQHTQTDSLPSGVTKDWLSSLTDEKGQRIIPDEDPEGDAFQSKIFNGLGTGYRHGYSVSSAGDVNGDGYDDIIIGAYGYSANTGRAYIYYGGQNMNTTADVVMTGASTSNYFGYSVSSAGDVNGDGYSDVIVGAYGYSSNTGRVYIYFGGTVMNNIADVTLLGTVSTSFGNSVSSAGDVNGDGFSDVIVGTQAYSTNTGRAYIYYGGSLMNNTQDVTLTGEAINNFFGCSVSSAGDVNGDGFGDVIVGAYGYSSNTGRVYIYHGGAAMNNTSDVVLTGETVNNYFGYSASSAGDVNGDGFSDVIAGAYGYLLGLGSAYIYLGAPVMSLTAFHQVTGEQTNNFFAYSVSSAGDVNGDGYSDVVIGAYAYSSNTGRAYVYFGGITMKYNADAIMTGTYASDNFGISVSSAGDVNGDGYSDIIVGAEGYNSSTGRAYMFDYYMKNDMVPDNILSAELEYSAFGRSVSSAGDVNGDGYNDVIVGAYPYSAYTGRVYVYYGGTLMDNTADVVISGSTDSENGFSVSSAGDVNGDGYADVIVGRPGYNSGQGRAYIYYGGAVMNNGVDVILTGAAAGDRFGESVSGAGDVNGDGYSDVIVGAKNNGTAGVNAGSAYVYFGGLSMNNTVDLTMTGEAAGDNFGTSVSSAGDVNGDGYDDVIIGADNNDEGGSNAGRAYIYLGGDPMYEFPILTLTGSSASYYFGVSVSSAGDVNGDGFSDVIVGAYGYSSFTGRAYVFYGGINMNSSANVTLSGSNIYDYFGECVSSAGDINGDGYSDVIVAAQNNDETGNAAGKSYIYYGGASMNNVVDVTMKGDTIGDTFGYSLSGAGDVNGDGYSDVIVGGPGNDVAGTNAGRAYIFTGSAISVKPIFTYVRDVPNDQGGKVNLKWARSGYDV
ncbi:MAG TPA: integrin alpha, partial [Ignavibacteria bacterium]|nr:integrin alpha [Ignavibacteria bacterium]HMR39796.1 integrin alpha [Ignavibacteria bacterium]